MRPNGHLAQLKKILVFVTAVGCFSPASAQGNSARESDARSVLAKFTNAKQLLTETGQSFTNEAAHLEMKRKELVERAKELSQLMGKLKTIAADPQLPKEVRQKAKTESDEAANAIAGIVCAGLCAYQPELCPVFAALADLFKAFFGSTEHREQFLGAITKAVAGANLGDDEIKAVSEFAKQMPAGFSKAIPIFLRSGNWSILKTTLESEALSKLSTATTAFNLALTNIRNNSSLTKMVDDIKGNLPSNGRFLDKNGRVSFANAITLAGGKPELIDEIMRIPLSTDPR